MRNHIRIEQQIKLFAEKAEEKYEDLKKVKEKNDKQFHVSLANLGFKLGTARRETADNSRLRTVT